MAKPQILSEFQQEIFRNYPPSKTPKNIESYRGKSLTINIPGAKSRAKVNNISYLKNNYNANSAAEVSKIRHSTMQYLINLALSTLNKYAEIHDKPALQSLSGTQLYHIILIIKNQVDEIATLYKQIDPRSGEAFQLKNDYIEENNLLITLNDIYSDYYKLYKDLMRLETLKTNSVEADTNRNTNSVGGNNKLPFGNLEGGRKRRYRKTRKNKF